MLRGNHPATMDAKGRLKIPAAFLRELREMGEKFYVTSESGHSAWVFPMKAWEAKEAKLAAASSHNRSKQRFLDRVNYFGQEVEIDGQGRLLIPALLREEAQISGEVNVLGDLDHLTIWNQARFQDRLRNNPLTTDDEKVLDDLGI